MIIKINSKKNLKSNGFTWLIHGLNRKKKKKNIWMIDAVLIFPSENFHRFGCNLGLKIEISDSCRLKYCFKSKKKKKRNFLGFVRMDWKKKASFSFWFWKRFCSRFFRIFFFEKFLFFFQNRLSPLVSKEKFLLIRTFTTRKTFISDEKLMRVRKTSH